MKKKDRVTLMLCPFCGSGEVSKPGISRQAFAWSLLLLGFPIPFLGRTRHCFDCGRDFRNRIPSGD